jgi:drug/metabolite transporter (DMT)-like permease
MPSWFFIALGAPLLWAISNIIDKALVSRYFQNKGTGALMIFSAVSGMIVMPFVAIVHPGVTEVSGVNALIMIASGLTTVFGLIPYFYALRRDDASLVVPIFQVIPVFNYILARIFLGEQLTSMQLLAGALIILGAVGISANYSQRRIHLKGKTLSLMLLSSLLMSLTNFLFKKVGLEETFWSTTFWAYVGYALAALVLYRAIRAATRRKFAGRLGLLALLAALTFVLHPSTRPILVVLIGCFGLAAVVYREPLRLARLVLAFAVIAGSTSAASAVADRGSAQFIQGSVAMWVLV